MNIQLAEGPHTIAWKVAASDSGGLHLDSLAVEPPPQSRRAGMARQMRHNYQATAVLLTLWVGVAREREVLWHKSSGPCGHWPKVC